MFFSLQNEVKVSVYQKRRRLAQAFDILKRWNNGQYVVVSQRWEALMLYMYPGISKAQIELNLYVLTGGNDEISASAISPSSFARKNRHVVACFSISLKYSQCWLCSQIRIYDPGGPSERAPR